MKWIVMWLLVLSAALRAERVEAREFNFAVEFPDGADWKKGELPSSDLTAYVQRRTHTTGMAITVTVLKIDGIDDTTSIENEALLRGFVKGNKKKGLHVVANRTGKIDGAPAHFYRFESAGRDAVRLATAILIADKRAYRFDVATRSAETDVDKQLRDVTRTFRFLNPPDLPPSSTAERIGYWIGRTLPWIAIAGFFIWLGNRRRNKEPVAAGE